VARRRTITQIEYMLLTIYERAARIEALPSPCGALIDEWVELETARERLAEFYQLADTLSDRELTERGYKPAEFRYLG